MATLSQGENATDNVSPQASENDQSRANESYETHRAARPRSDDVSQDAGTGSPSSCVRCLNKGVSEQPVGPHRKILDGEHLCDRCYQAKRRQNANLQVRTCVYCTDLQPPGQPARKALRQVNGKPCCGSCNMVLVRTGSNASVTPVRHSDDRIPTPSGTPGSDITGGRTAAAQYSTEEIASVSQAGHRQPAVSRNTQDLSEPSTTTTIRRRPREHIDGHVSALLNLSDSNSAITTSSGPQAPVVAGSDRPHGSQQSVGPASPERSHHYADPASLASPSARSPFRRRARVDRTSSVELPQQPMTAPLYRRRPLPDAAPELDGLGADNAEAAWLKRARPATSNVDLVATLANDLNDTAVQLTVAESAVRASLNATEPARAAGDTDDVRATPSGPANSVAPLNNGDLASLIDKDAPLNDEGNVEPEVPSASPVMAPAAANGRPVRQRQRPAHFRGFVIPRNVSRVIIPPRHSQGSEDSQEPAAPRRPATPTPAPDPTPAPAPDPNPDPNPAPASTPPALTGSATSQPPTSSPPIAAPPTADPVVPLLRLLEASVARRLAVAASPCTECKERYPGQVIETAGRCRKCVSLDGTTKAGKLGATNDMMFADFDNLPPDVADAFRGSSEAERQLVSRVQPVLSVHRLRGGAQLGYKGHVAAFYQDVAPIAKTLPRLARDVLIVIVRRARDNGDHTVVDDLRVRRTVVETMLKYLIQHNPYYRDIDVDMAALLALPEEGHLDPQTAAIGVNMDVQEAQDQEGENTNDDDDSDDDNDTRPIRTFVPSATSAAVSEDDLLRHNILPWPVASDVAVTEYATVGYWSMAFPELFPDGKGDLTAPRPIKVTISEYAGHLLRQSDRRFATHPRLRYVLLNMQMRHTANEIGRVFVTRNEDVTVARVRELLEAQRTTNHLSRRNHDRLARETAAAILRYGTQMPGTDPYWRARRSELIDLIGALGTPTIFYTLSSADFEWAELEVLAALYAIFQRPGELRSAFRRRLLYDHPDLAAIAFQARVDAFMEIVAPRLGFRDYWYRIEYQARGSPHVHGVAWLDGAPNVDILNMQDAADQEKVIKFATETVRALFICCDVASSGLTD